MTTSPTVIYTISDLQAIQNSQSGNYVLGANIDATGFSFTPIGSASNPFTGTFDGQGYTISNLTINNLSNTEAGLFGEIGATGTVSNVGLISVSVTSNSSHVGGLVGENFGTLSQSYVSGNVSGVNYVGVLVGFNGSSGSITQSYATGTANGQLDIGGLVGINQGAITESYATGATNPLNAGVAIGGLVGVNSGSITQSYATGLVGAGGGFALGGLVGSGAGTVTASYWDTETTGRSASAGGTGLTTAQLESGILPAGFDSTVWFDTVGQFPELRWQVLATPTTNLRITDIIPLTNSGESFQNSEPSLGVNPHNPAQMIGGAFRGPAPGASYFKSTDGGVTWSDYGSLPSVDKTIAWKRDGSSVLTASFTGSNVVQTFSGTADGSGFGSPISTVPRIDQPWMRTGPSDHVYLAGNGSNTDGKTAAVFVSTNGGSTYNEVTVDRVGGDPEDGPSVRLAVKDNTVYSAFTRFTSFLGSDGAGELYFTSQIVIVRSDNGGADGFTALGSGGNGVTIATPLSWLADAQNAPLTLGQERTAADLAIAVDPNNARHVVVAYGDAVTRDTGQLRLVVAESTNGGQTWSQKFSTTTSSSFDNRSALPGLSILPDGAIGLLYCNYTGTSDSNGTLTQYLLTTTDDFATTNLLPLGTETNTNPASTQGSLYLGDFFDLTNVGNTFYGTFCASNQDDGTNASLNSATTFLRNHSGTPGTANFQLLDTDGNPVANSIDPYVFSYQLLTAQTVSFGPPTFQLNAFGPNAGGWSSQNLYPRLLADINNDGNADIVGFGASGVYVSSANGTGGFLAPAFATGTSFWGAQTGGWSSQDAYPRELADVTNDGSADIVGFATNGVWVSAANGTGGFFGPAFANGTSFWGVQTGGWSSQDTYTRELADLNNDLAPDLVGFAINGVWVSLNTSTPGNTSFAGPTFANGTSFWGVQTGGWSSQDKYPRFMADVNGDGDADIVGFAQNGVWVSLNTSTPGNTSFAGPTFVDGTSFWGVQTGGWSSQDKYPRSIADVNGDGRPDIVGFATNGVWASLNTSTAGSVSFAAPTLVPNTSFWGAQTGGWSSNDLYPRELANITTGDAKADIVGFAQNGVWTSVSNSTASLSTPTASLSSSTNSISTSTTTSPSPVSMLDPGPSSTATISAPGVTNAGNNGGNAIVGSPISGNEETTGAGIMEFTGAVASGQTVTFDPNSTGTLKLDNSPGFAGTVAGLALGNYIDLTDIQFSSLHAPTYTPNAGNSGGTLTLTDGQHTANIALLGQYMAGSFATSSDGHGGTLITDTPLTTQPALLTPPHA